MTALLYLLFLILVAATLVACAAAIGSPVAELAPAICRDLGPVCEYPPWLVVATAGTGVLLALAEKARAHRRATGAVRPARAGRRPDDAPA